MVSLKNLVRDNIPIWRSANDIVMTAGRNGGNPPTHIAQLIGILSSHACHHNRAGQVWINPLYLRADNQPLPSVKIHDMYDIRNAAPS
eukprot:8201550-Pyramimonas_sp.AAC.1